MKGYLEQLAEGIRAVHGCESRHIGTTPVTEVFRGQVAWQGEVETFFLYGHPKAKRCYAWGYPDDERQGMLTVVAVLEIPPVISPKTAVKVVIAERARLTKRAIKENLAELSRLRDAEARSTFGLDAIEANPSQAAGADCEEKIYAKLVGVYMLPALFCFIAAALLFILFHCGVVSCQLKK